MILQGLDGVRAAGVLGLTQGLPATSGSSAYMFARLLAAGEQSLPWRRSVLSAGEHSAGRDKILSPLAVSITV